MARNTRHQWFSWRHFHSQGRAAQRSCGTQPFERRLRIEPLEDRRLLSIAVNTLVDELDGSILDGDVSLRDALAAAPSGETINFAVTGKINLTQGELLINRSLTINGPGANLLTIDASGNDPTPTDNNGDGSRVFNIDDGNNADDKAVVISGLTLTGGDKFGDGGGIRNAENLTVNLSTISGNVAHGSVIIGGGYPYPYYYHHHAGGGIWSARRVTVTGSTVSGNAATGGGGGIYGAGNLTVTNSAVSGNSTARDGGGIYGVSGGAMLLTNSTINGNSAVGNGGGIFGSNLTVTGGTISGNSARYGGGISGGNLTITGSTIGGNSAQIGGGGISDSGNLTVTATTIGGNTAGGSGGGISSSGNLTVTASTIGDNTAGSSGGGILGGNVTVITSAITGNSATLSGGGIWSNGNLTVTASTIGENTAGSSGGGVHATGSLVVLDASTVVANSASGEGGGVFSTSANLTIINSTISANAAFGHGGGIYVDPLNPAQAAASIAHSTIAYNRADAGNTSTRFGGGLFARAGEVRLDHSIVAENYNTTVFGTRSDLTGLLGATIDAHWSLIGHNAESGLAEAPLGSPDPQGNLIGGAVGGAIDPLLEPLARNGGPTPTYALLAGSPAIDAGNPAAVPGVGGVPLSDQRGNPFSRKFDGDGSGVAQIDIGAYERQSLVGLNLAVDTLLDEIDGNYSLGDLSLREATELARGSVQTADAITFAASLTSNGPATIVLKLGELAITEAMSIIGPGAGLLTIDASGNDLTPDEFNGDGSRIFNIDDGNVDTQSDISISGLTLTGGDVSDSGGAILNLENLTVTSSTISGNSAGGSGGGIGSGYGSYGNVTLIGGAINGNSAGSSGGGVSADNLAVTNSTIGGNSAGGSGGGISAYNLAVTNSTISGNSTDDSGGGISGGYVTVTGSIISGNSASYSGGGISASYVTVNHSTISGNSATSGSGGGIYGSYSYYGSGSVIGNSDGGNAAGYPGGNYGGTVTVTDSTISGNSAGDGGGGIYNSYGDLTVTSSTISGNSADIGGGIFSSTDLSDVRTTILGSTISGNTAASAGGGLYNFDGLTVIEFSTITGNQAPAGAGSGVASYGDSYTRTRVRSSIIAGNVNSDVNFVFDNTNSFQSSGYNLIGTGNALGRFNQLGDRTGVTNPLLGPLANNAGPTETHALLPGSPAIDAGNPTVVAGVGGVPAFDQRSAPFVRVYDGDGTGGARVDVGAFELQPIVVPALPGDYNQNGIVNLADYTVWRDALGTSGIPAYSAADGSGNGIVDQADYGIWKAHFGQTLPPPGAGSGRAAAAVTESIFEVSRAVVPVREESTLAPVQSNADVTRWAGVAMFDARTARHDSACGPRERNMFGVAHSVGDNLLLLLAIDRIANYPQQDFSVIDGGPSDDPRTDELDSQNFINEPLDVALTEWR